MPTRSLEDLIYLPPEVLTVIESNPRELIAASPESDIYALGCVVHQILYHELFTSNMGEANRNSKLDLNISLNSQMHQIAERITWGTSSANESLLAKFQMCCAENPTDRPQVQDVKLIVEMVAKKT